MQRPFVGQRRCSRWSPSGRDDRAVGEHGNEGNVAVPPPGTQRKGQTHSRTQPAAQRAGSGEGDSAPQLAAPAGASRVVRTVDGAWGQAARQAGGRSASRSHASRFSWLRGNPSMRNASLFDAAIASFSSPAMFWGSFKGNQARHATMLRQDPKKNIQKNGSKSVQRVVHARTVTSDGTIWPFLIISATTFPSGEPLFTCARSRSPALRWTTPKSRTRFAHCVPLPEPGPPRMKNTCRGLRSCCCVGLPRGWAQFRAFGCAETALAGAASCGEALKIKNPPMHIDSNWI